MTGAAAAAGVRGIMYHTYYDETNAISASECMHNGVYHYIYHSQCGRDNRHMQNRVE